MIRGSTLDLCGAVLCASFLLSACAGKAESDRGRPSAAGATNGESGSETVAGSVPSAGFSAVITGGGDAGGSNGIGGSETIAGAGTEVSGDGGAMQSAGGSVSSAGSSSGGAPAAPHCNNVECPSIPASCKHLVQGENDCCPTCTDTGCDVCSPTDCLPGTHIQTVKGACCPTCVANPPEACTVGQMQYPLLRDLLLRSSVAVTCKNSSDCVLVTEDNACAYTCNVPVSTIYAPSFVSDLEKNAPELCSTCDPPPHATCSNQAAACLNGMCVAADLQDP